MDIKPKYYRGEDGKDLFDRFEEGLLSKDEVRGFYKGNIVKYVARYQGKNGLQDLDKAGTYLHRLKQFETKLSGDRRNTTTGYLNELNKQYRGK